jgi:membrane-associated phospholipid phosphatase
MDLLLFVNYIGLYAPIILFILTIIILRNKTIFLQFFVSGFILNTILNIILKLSIKEIRPLHDKKALEIGVVNGARISFDKFGMPSGHAQTCGFCLSFIILTLPNHPFWIILIYSTISIISLFQRYINNNHTASQLLIGLIVGSLFGYLIYLLAKKNLVGNIKLKKDDDSPK